MHTTLYALTYALEEAAMGVPLVSDQTHPAPCLSAALQRGKVGRVDTCAKGQQQRPH
jgi:hypothetical protein